MADGQQNGGKPQDGNNPKNASDKLVDLLGFDPTKRTTISKGSKLFTEALAEITKERDEKAKGQATELFRKAIALSDERKKARQAFNSADAKFEKELGKVLNQINSLVSGKEPEPDGEQITEDASV